MKNVVFVAPFFRATTLRFVNAVASLPDVRLGVVSQDAINLMPPSLRARIDGHYRVDDALSAGHIHRAVTAMQAHFGQVDRLLGTLENAQEQLAAVRQALDIEGMWTTTATQFRDKSRMKQVLRQADLPAARFGRAHTAGEARAMVSQLGYPVVAKPIAGAAAIATYRLNSDTDLDAALNRLQPSSNNPIQLEEFMTGLERSFETVSIQGKPVWSSYTEYAPQPLHVLENKWIQWTVTLPREETTDDFEAIKTLGHQAIEALGMRTGLTHLEWFRRPDGTVAISEVAARPPGAQIMSLNSYAHDTDMYQAWARLMVHDEWEIGEKQWAAGCAFFRAEQPGRVTRVRGLDEAQKLVGHHVQTAKLPNVGWHTTSGYEGDGFAIVKAETTEEVRHALATLISLVKIETT